ncbi:MAG: AAA family ATPase, partial [Candidatus Acidiferrales bacterium]
RQKDDAMSTLFAPTDIGGLPFPQSLTEAYRPQTIGEFVGLAKHKAILTKLVGNPRPCALLFFGGPGTGKSSMAQAFARQIEAEIHHLPSQDAKLETLQSVAATCQRVPYDFQIGCACKWHAVILEEADLLSSASQNYLLSKLDGTSPCPQTLWILTANSVNKFEDRFTSRLIQLPKFNGYSAGGDVRALLEKIWTERAGDTPMPDFSRVPTSNVREALQWLELELLMV